MKEPRDAPSFFCPFFSSFLSHVFFYLPIFLFDFASFRPANFFVGTLQGEALTFYHNSTA